MSSAHPRDVEASEVDPVDPATWRDPLDVVDAVGRVLAGSEVDDPTTGYGEALRLVAEAYEASLTAVIRFAEDGAHVTGIWSGGHFERDPQVRIGNDVLPPGSPLRTSRRPVVFGPEGFGENFAQLLREIGPGHTMLVAPIFDGDQVLGGMAILAPDMDVLERRDKVAIQLCGELLWRHIRHHESREELYERAEVAEMLARISRRLHQGAVDEVKDLLDDVFLRIGEYVGADVVEAYEADAGGLVPLFAWHRDGSETAVGSPELTARQRRLLATGGVQSFDELNDSALTAVFAPGSRSGVVVPVVGNGELRGVFVVARETNRPVRPAHVELVSRVVQLFVQFRARIAGELDLVRRGVVEQARTEIAEAFLNAPASEIDTAVLAALEQVGGVFRARRVRWVEIDPTDHAGSLVLEWADGRRPHASTEWTLAPDVVEQLMLDREPRVFSSEAVRSLTGVDAGAPTLVIPAVIGDDMQAALTLTGDGVGAEMPEDERRALIDLAGLVHQARLRAHQELAAEHRQMLDELQLRLAARFLDRGVRDRREVLDWILGEIGAALDADVLAFAEYVGTADGEVHWWARNDEAIDASELVRAKGALFTDHFRSILGASGPTVTRSRLLPEAARARVEDLAGSEFSILVAPLRAPGIALMLGIAVLRDREWSAAEVAMLQQTVAQIRQFIEVLASRAQLEYDATHDALTGLANRRRIHDEFERLVEEGRRGAVLMIDVDRFKVVNDSLGHSAGDAVLIAIADRIRTSVRDTELVGRLGGDEFAVMMTDGVSRLELAATAQRLIAVVREPIMVRGTTVIPTCSIGIADSGPHDDVEAVMRHADAAMYDAKAKGRDRYEFFDDAHRETLRQRLHLETGLRRGLSAGEFVPWFQPEYDLVRNEIVGVEALVRWNHPTDGVLDASRFIDVAEEIGLAPEMSRMVIERSFETLQGWIAEGFDTRMRVNVAAAQLQSDELADQIAAALERYSIPADRLCVEITERSLMLDADSAVVALGRVRELGVEVAVDDFGTGFSSLARLKHLPVDTLKIDRSFVSGIVKSATDREIVRTIIWLSRGLGLDVVAEGVEQPDQAELLVELGCRRAQGWLWSPAVPAEAVPRLARV